MQRTVLAVLLAVATALVIGVAPVHAQSATASVTATATVTGTATFTTVTDLGSNIYMVDGANAGLPTLLPSEDVQKIAALLRSPLGTGYKIISPVSPDDEAVLAQTGQASTIFLNLRDGEIIPVQTERLSPSTNYVWLDDYTLGFLAVDPRDTKVGVIGIAIDRRTGELSYDEPRLAAIAGLNQEKRLVTLMSSNLRKVLMLENTEAKPNPLFQPPAPGLGRGYDTLPPNDKFLISEGTWLQIADVDTGEIHDVIQIGHNMQVLDVAFSPDGSKFSVTTTWMELSRTLRTTGGPRLSDITYQDVTGQLPPAENPYFQNNAVTILDFPSGELRTLRAAEGDGWFYEAVSWSADNQTLMIQVERPGQAKGRLHPQYYPEFHAGAALRFYDAELNEVQRLERPEVDSTQLRSRFVSRDEVLIETRYGTNGHPYYYNLTTGEFRNIADRAGVYNYVMATNTSREIVYVFTSYTAPPEFYRAGWDGAEAKQLTSLNEEVHKLSQTAQYSVSFTLRNGETYDGVLILPADASFPPKDVPIIVWQAGGPTLIMSNIWQNTVESPHVLLPNFGFGVLVVPIYGRYGVGQERFSALVDGNNFGQADIDVQAEIVEELRDRGWADKVGIVGCSYGGYFVTQSITRHPETYDAAHTMCTIVDMIVEWNVGDGILAPWVFGRTPWEALEEYRSDSPIYQAKYVRTPVLAFHGTQDFLPLDVMRNFMLQVVSNKVPAKMLIFQGAGHNFSNTPAKLAEPYALYGAQEQILWFRKYLGQ
jgi:dipeptidyl aminopeptidase/acylaminoacyl peptidase